MQNDVHDFMPILFKVLFGFIIINMIVNLGLLYTKKLRIYKLLAMYWPTVLFSFIMQAQFQSGNLQVTYAYSLHLINLTIWAMIGFEILGRKFPLKRYGIFYLAMYPLSYALNAMNFSFTVVAMPFSIATALPMVHSFYMIHIKDRKESTKLQKVLGFIMLGSAVHCINFAIFRMDPGAQLWGWLTTYVLSDCLAILLPSIALERANMTENQRLQNVVDERTADLNKSMKDNESLLKMVLHDLSSPLMTMRFYLAYIKPTPDMEDYLEKAKKSQSAMEKIILEIKNMYGQRSRRDKVHLKPVGLEECFNDVSFIFAQKLEKKNISLIFNNQLSPNTRVLADQTTLTHSVLSNLVSNGLKFSNPNSQIEVIAKEGSDGIVLEVKDQGPGIPEDVIQNIMLEKDNESSEGTSGEVGLGLGLSIVKSLVDSYGGQIEFDSRLKHIHPQEHGTSIRITLDRA